MSNIAYNLGSAYIQILPSMRGFGKDLIRNVVPASDKAGKTAGQEFSKTFEKSAASGDSLDKFGRELKADAQDVGGKAGKAGSAAFAEKFNPAADLEGINLEGLSGAFGAAGGDAAEAFSSALELGLGLAQKAVEKLLGVASGLFDEVEAPPIEVPVVATGEKALLSETTVIAHKAGHEAGEEFTREFAHTAETSSNLLRFARRLIEQAEQAGKDAGEAGARAFAVQFDRISDLLLDRIDFDALTDRFGRAGREAADKFAAAFQARLATVPDINVGGAPGATDRGRGIGLPTGAGAGALPGSPGAAGGTTVIATRRKKEEEKADEEHNKIQIALLRAISKDVETIKERMLIAAVFPGGVPGLGMGEATDIPKPRVEPAGAFDLNLKVRNLGSELESAWDVVIDAVGRGDDLDTAFEVLARQARSTNEDLERLGLREFRTDFENLGTSIEATRDRFRRDPDLSIGQPIEELDQEVTDLSRSIKAAGGRVDLTRLSHDLRDMVKGVVRISDDLRILDLTVGGLVPTMERFDLALTDAIVTLSGIRSDIAGAPEIGEQGIWGQIQAASNLIRAELRKISTAQIQALESMESKLHRDLDQIHTALKSASAGTAIPSRRTPAEAEMPRHESWTEATQKKLGLAARPTPKPGAGKVDFAGKLIADYKDELDEAKEGIEQSNKRFQLPKFDFKMPKFDFKLSSMFKKKLDPQENAMVKTGSSFFSRLWKRIGGNAKDDVGAINFGEIASSIRKKFAGAFYRSGDVGPTIQTRGLLSGIKFGASEAEKAAADAGKKVGNKVSSSLVDGVLTSMVRFGPMVAGGLAAAVAAGIGVTAVAAVIPVSFILKAVSASIDRDSMNTVLLAAQKKADIPELTQEITVGFQGAYGADYEDFARVFLKARQNAQGITDDMGEVRRATELAFSVAQTSGTDASEIIRDSFQLVKTGVASDVGEALDLITYGLTGGANSAGDMLDVLEEYPATISKLGISGKTWLGIIEQGLAGGAYNADKVADSLKEMGIRITSMDKPAVEGLKLLGMDPKQLINALNLKDPKSKEAASKKFWDDLFDALRKAKPAQREHIMSLIGGGPAEDLASAVMAIDPSALDVAADGLAEQVDSSIGNSLTSRIEVIKRNVQGFFSSIFTGVGDAITQSAGSDEVTGPITTAIETYREVMKTELGKPFAERDFGAMVEAGLGVASAFLTGFNTWWDEHGGEIRTKVFNISEKIGKWFGEKGGELAEVVGQVFIDVGVAAAAGFIKGFLEGMNPFPDILAGLNFTGPASHGAGGGGSDTKPGTGGPLANNPKEKPKGADHWVTTHGNQGYWVDKNDKPIFLSGKAAGGPVKAGMPYLVGELGPEPFIPKTDGYIIPNQAYRGMIGAAGRGGDTSHSTTYALSDTTVVANDPEELFRELQARASLQALAAM